MNKDEESTRVINIYIFQSIFLFNFIISYLKSYILYFVLLSWLEEICNLFLFMEDTFLNCKQYVGAGINTLISISDGLAPSIFCRKMEKARPMREEMDRKNFYFLARVSILTFMLWFILYFSLFVPWLGV